MSDEIELDSFISVVVNESMEKVCYEGGWILSPYNFAVSGTDPLEGYTDDEIFNEDGTVKTEIYELLQQQTTEQFSSDLENGNVWCQLPFSSVTKATSTTLTHHVVIPATVNVGTATKQVKTIYFLYKDNNDQVFVYALARATNYMVYETGVTQSFFFTFGMTNGQAQNTTEFVINYTYPQEIADHNTSSDVHDHFVAKDGSREIIAPLSYSQSFEFSNGLMLITKEYLEEYVASLISQTICPAGTLRWWAGLQAPSGWAVRDGSWLNVADYPELYSVIGTRYGSQINDGQSQFQLMDDRGLFIRACEVNDNSYNYSSLSGVEFGGEQTSGGSVTLPYNGYTVASGHGTETYRAGQLIGVSGRSEVSEYLESIGAVMSSRELDLNSSYPKNRNYLPIIKLG